MIPEYRMAIAYPTKNERLPLVGICVSYNYFDTLQFMLPVNYLHFDKLYIVTQEDDTTTIDFCKKFANVIVLYYNFKANNKNFDKFGALNYAQTLAYVENPDSWYLLLDSDILLPSNMIDILLNEQLDSECLYGACRLFALQSSDLLDRSSLKASYDILINRSHSPPSILGYFQLYKKKFVYHPMCFSDASKGDLSFGYINFTIFCILENLNVIHLGPEGINWFGKIQSFVDDRKISLDDIYYLCHIPVNNCYYTTDYELVRYGSTTIPNIKTKIANKKYSWRNRSIQFLTNGRMDAFGLGFYTQRDMHTIQAKFGGRINSIVFNNDYTKFTSTRIDDGEIITSVLI